MTPPFGYLSNCGKKPVGSEVAAEGINLSSVDLCLSNELEDASRMDDAGGQKQAEHFDSQEIAGRPLYWRGETAGMDRRIPMNLKILHVLSHLRNGSRRKQEA